MTFESGLPLTYWAATTILMACCAFAVANMQRSWTPGYAAVLGTVFAWYFIEPLYFPEEFIGFSNEVLELGFLSVCVFLIAFTLATPAMVVALAPRSRPQRPTSWYSGVTIERLVGLVVTVWLITLTYGVWRSGGDLIGALFPLEGRSGTAVAMFGRAGGAAAGPTGFIVSTADYLYRLCLGTFGLLLPVARKSTTRSILVALILISWPSVFLLGTRNVALAVVVPFLASLCLFTRTKITIKAAALGISFFAIEFAMRAMVNLRNEGFADFSLSKVSEGKHLGLNMASELMYVTRFLEEGRLSLSYGQGYLDQVTAIIPRAFWSDKPLVGIDYALARGFGGAEGDLGVFATVATGLIGQGVLNFGSWFGAMAVGLLMAGWVGILNRLRVDGGLPRAGLFLIGLGLTFNLGREISFQILFPFVFGLLAVWGLEYIEKRRGRRPLLTAEVKGAPRASSVPHRRTLRSDVRKP